MIYTLFITNDNIPEGSAGCAKIPQVEYTKEENAKWRSDQE